MGLWQGNYQNQNQLWLRWWDRDGNLLLTGWEQTELERLRVEQERDLANRAESELETAESELEKERQKNARLAERLRAAGLDPNV
ncbi:MAG: hypothetical protein J7647_17260 [Cyanobacteria bacterium SBLK]|nr:hypothetical protein [Cyanobacteria bacterium SBLK]